MPVIAGLEIDTANYRLLVNPTGRFEVGGPMGDAGLTGRKIIIDTYGGMARHGGGAFSGKDPSKVDRSAAYAMRWVAKNVVAAGLADRCETQVAYAIGKAKPVGLFVECFGTEQVPVERIQDAVLEVFDLRPAAIIRDLDLLRPDLLADRGLRALRPRGAGLLLGAHRPHRRAALGRRASELRAAREAAGPVGHATTHGRGRARALVGQSRGTGPAKPGREGRRESACPSRGWPSTCRCRTWTGRSTTWCRSALAADAVPGCRVRVRFAGRLTGGSCCSGPRPASTRASSRSWSGWCRPSRCCPPEIAGLARAVADRYGGTLADVLRLAIPPRHAAVERRRRRAHRREAAGPRQPDRRRQRPGTGPEARGPRYPAGAVVPGRAGRGPRAARGLVRAARPALAGRDRAGRGRRHGRRAGDADRRARRPGPGPGRRGAGRRARPRPARRASRPGLGPAERYRRWLAVARGQVRVVAGTRSAMFAPVAGLGLVVIWDDGDDLHAEPRAPYPHAREVLALRAHRSGAAALLGGFARTAEAAQLVASGWAGRWPRTGPRCGGARR